MKANTTDKDKALRIVMQELDERAEQVKLSDGFTDRLMQRIEEENSLRRSVLRRKRTWLAVGIAAALALLAGIAIHVFYASEDSTQLPLVVKQVEGKKDVVPEEKSTPQDTAELIQEIRMMQHEVAQSPLANVPDVETHSAEDLDDEEMWQESDDIGECLVIIPSTPFALKCHLNWEEGESSAANISSMECVTIKENDTVLIKSPSGEITRGAMYVYEREKKENDIVYLQEGHRLSSDLRIYYKKARLNADGQTYSYIDALALLDYPTCSTCGKN